MSVKLKTRQTDKGGKVRSVTDGNSTVDIYSRTKKVNGYTYTLYEVADFTHGKRRMRSFYVLDRAIAEAEDIAIEPTERRSVLEAIAFVNRVAELAEAEDHHPDVTISYKKVTLRWTTHSEGGITERDRVLAVRSAALVAAQ